MNKPALRKLIKHLISIRIKKTEQAARFNMHYFGVGINEIGPSDKIKGFLEAPICGTQACLAGETVLGLKQGFLLREGGIQLYAKLRRKNEDIEEAAVRVLGLTNDQRERLFYFKKMTGRYGWPNQFQIEYENAKTPSDRLGVAIRRVAHFINTDGLE